MIFTTMRRKTITILIIRNEVHLIHTTQGHDFDTQSSPFRYHRKATGVSQARINVTVNQPEIVTMAKEA